MLCLKWWKKQKIKWEQNECLLWEKQKSCILIKTKLTGNIAIIWKGNWYFCYQGCCQFTFFSRSSLWGQTSKLFNNTHARTLTHACMHISKQQRTSIDGASSSWSLTIHIYCFTNNAEWSCDLYFTDKVPMLLINAFRCPIMPFNIYRVILLHALSAFFISWSNCNQTNYRH